MEITYVISTILMMIRLTISNKLRELDRLLIQMQLKKDMLHV